MDFAKIFVEENTWAAATKFGAVNEIESLLHRGLRLNTKIQSNGSNWMLPIHLATKHNHIAMLENLIENSAEILSRNAWGEIPLDYAIFYTDCEGIKWHFKALQRELNKREPLRGIESSLGRSLMSQVLQQAARLESTEKLSFLLSLVEPEMETILWDGVLPIAVRYGRVIVTKYLLNRECNPFSPDEKARLAIDVPFCQRSSHPYLPANDVKEYEQCIDIIEEAMKR